MAVFAFKTYTIQLGGTPQPLIGTYLTAALTQSQVNAVYNATTQNSAAITLTVADSSMFVGQNWLNVIDPGTYATERALILAVPSSTTVQVQGLRSPHAGGAYGTGAWVALGGFAQNVFVQGIAGNAGVLYLGVIPNLVKATGAGVIFQLFNTAAGVNPYTFSTSRQGLADTETLSQYWIDGTTGDGYLPSIGAV